MKGQKELEKWSATYGDDKEDIKASMYGADLMIEFAKYYHNQQLTLTDVSQQRELLNSLAEEFNDSTHTYVGQRMIEKILKEFNCG